MQQQYPANGKRSLSVTVIRQTGGVSAKNTPAKHNTAPTKIHPRPKSHTKTTHHCDASGFVNMMKIYKGGSYVGCTALV